MTNFWKTCGWGEQSLPLPLPSRARTGPPRASSGPVAINSTGPCVGVAAQEQEGSTTNANQFKSLIKHWYFMMQSSNCSLLMCISKSQQTAFEYYFCSRKIFKGPLEARALEFHPDYPPLDGTGQEYKNLYFFRSMILLGGGGQNDASFWFGYSIVSLCPFVVLPLNNMSSHPNSLSKMFLPL